MAQRWLLAFVVALAMDMGLAQVAKLVVPHWDPAVAAREFRVTHPNYHHDLRPNVDTEATMGPLVYPLRTNSLGFRDFAVRDVALESEQPRVLLLGDSFTEGVGFAYGKTFAGRFTEALAARGTEVLNAGVVSYAPSIYHRKAHYWLEEKGLAFDHVVVVLDMSDIEDEALLYRRDEAGNIRTKTKDLAPWSGTESPESATQLTHLKTFLKNNSLAFHLAAQVRAGLRRETDPVAAVTGRDRVSWTYDESLYEAYGREGMELCRAGLSRLHALLTKRGIGMTLVVYPWPDQIVGRETNSVHVRELQAWAREHEVKFVDLFPVFLEAGEPADVIARYFIPFDVHWNAEGHALVARALLRGAKAALVALADRADGDAVPAHEHDGARH